MTATKDSKIYRWIFFKLKNSIYTGHGKQTWIWLADKNLFLINDTANVYDLLSKTYVIVMDMCRVSPGSFMQESSMSVCMCMT